MRALVVGVLVMLSWQGVVRGEDGARCQAEVGEVVSLGQQPAVAGTQLGVGFDVVPGGEKGEPASPWCNQMACGRVGHDGETLCVGTEQVHCFTWLGNYWSRECYRIRI